ncbi:hypothetical protein AB0P12_06995 [Streptomyces subrutilus]|uniref:hypothetical protein n=1 Tax=Streptomyces subrutilus TaxID=36818 RepID=UPI003441664B
MARTAYIYVPKPSLENLNIGLDEGLWGWHESTLDKAGGRSNVQSLQPGDFVVLAHGGPQPRVAPGGWRDAVLKRVVVAQVTKPYFQSQEIVWKDSVYPERIGIDVLDEELDVAGRDLGDAAAEALRLSANKQGSAVLLSGVAALAHFATELPVVADPAQFDLNAVTVISHGGAESAIAQILTRREQSKIRKAMLNGATEFSCALCGKILPARFIRAAHIKRRAHASRDERLHMANIMPACLLGCDELFEHGYVYVTSTGTVALGGNHSTTPDLVEAAKALDGLIVTIYGPQREPYFAWHRNNIA